jgi:glucose/arabinose dehydrogenase
MTNRPHGISLVLILLATLFPVSSSEAAPPRPREEDFYRLLTFPLPDEVVLEVGGLDWLDREKTRLLVCTRRGELWVIDNVYAGEAALAEGKTVRYKRMLFGLHEPLGLLSRPEGIYMAQRSELTRVRDIDGDDRIDEVKCFCNDWEISGSYHEYAFGPKLDREGNLWVTLNRPFGGGHEATAYWRGWAVKIDPKGKMHPVCPGLRSPAGLGTNAAGDMFYTDNQGDWVAVCKLSQLKYGKFQGNPIGLQSCDHPLSTMKNPGRGFPRSGLLWPEAVKVMPQLVAPAVWFPYPQMGKSHSDILNDSTRGGFGPFENQLFIGDQGNAVIVRVFLEKVDGEYQGACFPFRKGFISGVLRMCWGKDGSMFVGGTNRGWGGGPRPYGLQRLVWTGKVPFEVHEMRATPTGFHLTFTQAVDPKTAGDVKSYAMRAWTYRYHSDYGDKPRDTQSLPIQSAAVSGDGKAVTLVVEGCKPYYVHELRLDGVRNQEGSSLLHPIGYYTLNRIPK